VYLQWSQGKQKKAFAMEYILKSSEERSIFEGTVPYNSCMFRMYAPPFIFSMSLVFDSAINNIVVSTVGI